MTTIAFVLMTTQLEMWGKFFSFGFGNQEPSFHDNSLRVCLHDCVWLSRSLTHVLVLEPVYKGSTSSSAHQTNVPRIQLNLEWEPGSWLSIQTVYPLSHTHTPSPSTNLGRRGAPLSPRVPVHRPSSSSLV